MKFKLKNCLIPRVPSGFTLTNNSNHTLPTHQCLTVTESNPVIPHRFYQFTLKTKLHLMNQTGLLLEPSGLLYKHGGVPCQYFYKYLNPK